MKDIGVRIGNGVQEKPHAEITNPNTKAVLMDALERRLVIRYECDGERLFIYCEE